MSISLAYSTGNGSKREGMPRMLNVSETLTLQEEKKETETALSTFWTFKTRHPFLPSEVLEQLTFMKTNNYRTVASKTWKKWIIEKEWVPELTLKQLSMSSLTETADK